jgi:hypothetical protein
MKSRSNIIKSFAKEAAFLVAVALAASPSIAQEAKILVKVNPELCWVDTKEYVKTHARRATADDQTHIIQVVGFANMAGDIVTQVAALPAKDKNGQEACEILVSQVGNGSLGAASERVNALNGMPNLRNAQLIAANTQAKQKQRDKEAKKAKQ